MAPNPVPLSPRRLAASGLRLRPMESAFREGSATIVMPTSNSAFFNPVQEFNRDLSVLAIKTWSEVMNEDLKRKWEAKCARKTTSSESKRSAGAEVQGESVESNKKVRLDDGSAQTTTPTTEPQTSSTKPQASASTSATTAYRPQKFTILEALSATGLRSIRYAREIPLLRYVMANDLSAGAIKAMKRNIALNFPADRPIQEWVPESDQVADEEDEDMDTKANGEASTSSSTTAPPAPTAEISPDEEAAAQAAIHPDCKIRLNEGDALDVMYSHRRPNKRFDVVDLDPYGTAAPFIDGAIQSVADGGLLCVTCTDSAVLASNSYPEKAFALYGGSSTRAEYSHEMGLRLVLHLISSTAAKYGRYIEPQLSLSIDFYVRLFIKVHTGPARVKNLGSQTGIVYTCSRCANFHEQPLGRATKTPGKNDTEFVKYQNGAGPPAGLGSKCDECGSNYLIAGPMWLDPIHNPSFCTRLLETLERDPAKSKTAPRIRGMVGLAAEELPSSLFYFLPQRVTGVMHCSAPSFLQTTSALLNAGYEVSRSHTIPGSIKTTAPRARVFDLMRSWIAHDHPVKMENVKDNSPSKFMLTKQPVEEFDFKEIVDEHKYHPRAMELAGRAGDKAKGKTTRYQAHPQPNWGPGKAAPMK